MQISDNGFKVLMPVEFEFNGGAKITLRASAIMSVG